MSRTPALLLLLCYVGFVSLGLPDGLLGVAWPSIRGSFGLPLEALGPLLVSTTAGYVLSSFSSGLILARINVGALLALSCFATATSLLGYTVVPSWWMMVVLGSLAGLGAGAIDAGLNTYVATHHSPRMLNWLHAFYGIGATSGPILMTSVLMAGLPWQRGYLLVGMGQVVLGTCFALTCRLWPASSARDRAPTVLRSAPAASTLRLPAAWLGIAAFFVYTGVEAAAGAWLFSLFVEARAFDAATAGTLVSLYWGGLSGGRLMSGFVVSRVPVGQLLRLVMGGMLLATGVLTFSTDPTIGSIGVVLLGFSAGPVFPSLISTTPARVGQAHTANTVGFQVAAAALGQSLLPAACGVLAGRFGLEILGPSLMVATIALILVGECMSAMSEPRAADAAAPAAASTG
jgi:fucose permease